MSSYPKYIYHAHLEPRVVQTAEEHEAAGPEWAESPVFQIVPTAPFDGVKDEQLFAAVHELEQLPKRRGRPRKDRS